VIEWFGATFSSRRRASVNNDGLTTASEWLLSPIGAGVAFASWGRGARLEFVDLRHLVDAIDPDRAR
jgi:hypothetical protein